MNLIRIMFYKITLLKSLLLLSGADELVYWQSGP